MRSIGLILLILGIGSCVVHFMEREMSLLQWIDNWGPEVAWGIRGGLVVVGLLLFMSGKKGDKKK